MIEDIDGLWFGPREEMTPTSDEIIGIEVVNALTGNQTTAIITTIVAALVIPPCSSGSPGAVLRSAS